MYYYASSDLTTPQDLFKYCLTTSPVAAQAIIKAHTGVFPTTLSLGTTSGVNDRYKIMAYAAEPRSKALGGVASVAGFRAQNLQSFWLTDLSAPDILPQDQYKTHQWHSAEFRFTNSDQEYYWQNIMIAFGNASNPLPSKP